jgi:predicted phage-related endonuclease
MKTLDLQQGSEAWASHRSTARNASDASAVLGCSPYMTRGKLLQLRHMGIAQEHDAGTMRRFADGHAIEAAQLTGAEEIIGEPLYPVVGVETVDGIELSASFDGITMDESTVYECKTLNGELRSTLNAIGGIEANDGRLLPKYYRVQMEQQLMVCGGERVLFVAATADGTDVRRCWYTSDPALRVEILAAWKQFDIDLAAYVQPERAAAIVAEPVQALPAVSVQVTGSIAVVDNFKTFEVAMRDFLEHRLIRKPKTDQDFADLDVQIKAMKGAEAALESAEVQMLAQIQSVDSAKKTKDMLLKLVAENRRMAEKLLTNEKERRRGDIAAAGITALREHVAALNIRLGKPYMPQSCAVADFGGAIKGLRSLTSMEDAVATLLANSKIAANEAADRIQANREDLKPGPGGIPGDDWIVLFPDFAQVCTKAPEDFRNLRIARVEAERQRRQAERERIRQEEVAKLQRQQRETQEAEDALISSFDAAAHRIEQDSVPYIQKAIMAYESTAKDWENDARPRVREAYLVGRAYLKERMESAQARHAAETAKPAFTPSSPLYADLNNPGRNPSTGEADIAAPAPVSQAAAGNVVPLGTRAPAPESNATIRLGQINERLAPIQLSADGLASLGFTPVATEKSVKLYRESDFDRICAALVQHIEHARQPLAA